MQVMSKVGSHPIKMWTDGVPIEPAIITQSGAGSLRERLA